MTSWPYDIGPVSVEEAREKACPKCGAGAGSSCLYTTDLFTYVGWPEYGLVPKHHQGDVMKAVHQERRDAVRRERMKTRRGGTVTTATPGVRGAAAAMRAWDVEEFERMRAWLAEHGWLLIEAGLERRPDGSVRGDSYAMPGYKTMPAGLGGVS